MVWMLAPLVVYAAVLVLHWILPARAVPGYVRDASGEPLRYRLNGLLVMIAVVAGWAGLCRADLLAWDALYVNALWSGAGAVLLGLGFTFAIVLPAPPTGRGFLADLFLGRHENPQWAGVDAKMYLYLIGAVLLELNLLSACAHHVLTYGPSPTVLLYTGVFSFFACEYLYFERVHLYTYDFFAERVGFKLGWGCFAFYPFFYPIGAWSEAGQPPPDVSVAWLVGSGLVFFGGWALSRGANLQKYWFKRFPEAKYLGLLAPETIGDDQRRLLVNGFWGVSRHVNYLGEVLMASGLALALGRPLDPWPWLYPLYYVLLLVTREWDDDRRCAAKYGPLWDEYKRRVPARIVPGIY